VSSSKLRYIDRFFVTNKEIKRDVRMEMFAKSMKRFNLHTPVTNVQAQI